MTTPSTVRVSRWRGAAAVAAALAVTALSACSADLADVPLPGGGPSDTYELTADFTSALNLPRNAPVKLGGQVVGSVGEVEVRDYVAQVDLNVDVDVQLPVGTRAEVRLTAPVGEAFVALVPPPETAPPEGAIPDSVAYLAAGDHLGTQQTSIAPDTTDLLAAISTAVTGGSFADLGTITREMSLALDGRGDDVQHLLGELDELATTANDRRATIDASLDALDALAATAAGESESLAASLEALGPAIDVLVTHQDPATRLLEALTTMSVDTQSLLQQTSAQITSQLGDTATVLAQIVAQQDALIPIMTGVSAFGSQLDLATPGDYATFDLSIEGAIHLSGGLPILGRLDGPPQLGPFNPAPLPVSRLVDDLLSGLGIPLQGLVPDLPLGLPGATP